MLTLNSPMGGVMSRNLSGLLNWCFSKYLFGHGVSKFWNLYYVCIWFTMIQLVGVMLVFIFLFTVLV